MTDLALTYRFSPFETPINNGVNIDFQDIVKYINDRNSGTAAWDNVVSTYQLGSFKNRIINPLFSVNQRQSTLVADDTYHMDQWYALNQSGNVTIAQQSDQENGQPTNLRMTQPDVGAKRLGVAQIVESINCRDFRGKSVILSARIRCSSSQAIRYAIIEHTGTADTVTSDVVDTWTSTDYTSGAGKFFIASLTITGVGSTTPTANTWTSISLTGSITSSANNLIVVFWSEGTLAQNATLDIGKVSLEAGAVVTAFESRLFPAELALCQRYYEKSYNLATAPGTASTSGNVAFRASGTSVETPVWFRVFKRTSPTVTMYSPATGASGQIRDVTGAADAASAITYTGDGGFLGQKSTAGTDTNLYAFHWIARADL